MGYQTGDYKMLKSDNQKIWILQNKVSPKKIKSFSVFAIHCIKTYSVNSSFHLGCDELFTVLVLRTSASAEKLPFPPCDRAPGFRYPLSLLSNRGDPGGVVTGDTRWLLLGDSLGDKTLGEVWPDPFVLIGWCNMMRQYESHVSKNKIKRYDLELIFFSCASSNAFIVRREREKHLADIS